MPSTVISADLSIAYYHENNTSPCQATSLFSLAFPQRLNVHVRWTHSAQSYQSLSKLWDRVSRDTRLSAISYKSAKFTACKGGKIFTVVRFVWKMQLNAFVNLCNVNLGGSKQRYQHLICRSGKNILQCCHLSLADIILCFVLHTFRHLRHTVV